MDKTAPDLFADWLSTSVRPVLRDRGWTKTGSTFHLRAREGWGVINFQKSAFGSRHETHFTVNLGVSLDRLASIRDVDPARKPPFPFCNWQERIGFLLDSPRDTWWTIDGGTNLGDLTSEVLPLVLERALPTVSERLTAAGFLRTMQRADSVGRVPFHERVLQLLASDEGPA